MKMFPAGLVLAVLLSVLAIVGRSRAQTAGYQLVSNAAGYQFQVPSDWVPGTLPSAGDTIYGSTLTAQGAYVVVKHPDVATSDAALQIATADALSPSATQTSYTVTSAAAPIQIAGADAANSGAAGYVTEDGTSGNEYVVAAVRGTTGYLLIVDVTSDFDAASPSVAQTILGSFQLTSGGAAAAPPPTGPTPSPPGPTPPPPTATSRPSAVVLTPQPLPLVTPAPMPTQTPTMAPLTPPSSPVGSNAVVPVSRAATPILPVTGGLAAATSPPPGCASSSNGPCVTRCIDGTWSSNISGAGGCNGHGGEAH